MKHASILCMIAAIGILFTCTEAPEELIPNPNPNPNPGSDLELTDEERLKVLEECSQIVNTMGDLRSEAMQQALVAYLDARPEFEEAGILENTVWAYFHDGRIVMFVPTWEDGPIGGRIAVDESSGRRDVGLTEARTGALPESNKVTLFNGVGRAFVDDRNYLKSIFSRSRTEYVVETKDATIENLENVNDLGIFFFSTHGGVALIKPKTALQGLFGLWTTDTTSLANESKYEADLNSRMLVYMHAVDDDRNIKEWHYAITRNFVAHHSNMNFAANALMYIDACNGMSEPAAAFRETMIKKAANGNATYIGWTAPMSSTTGTPTARFIFDRLLGAHDESVLMEDPKQRPFDWSSVFDDMQRVVVQPKLGVSEHGGRLAYTSVYTTEPILTPSIEYITTGDYENLIYLHGLFGDGPADDGKVIVDGVAVKIKGWTPYLIVCELPSAGRGSAGNVIVSVRGNESNAVPLSQWTIHVNLSRDEFGVMTEANLNLRIRADVHRYRTKAGDAPKTDRPDSLGLLNDPNNLGWMFSTASTGTFNVGGQRISSCTMEDCSLRDTESASSRNGALPYKPTESKLGYGAFYKWSVDMKTLYISFFVRIPDVGFNMEYYTACPNNDPINSGQSYSGHLDLTVPSEDIPTFEFKLDDNWNIRSGRVSKTQNTKWGRCLTSGTFITTVVWQGATPEFGPKSDTEARIAGE